MALTPFHRPPARDALLGDLLGGLRRLHGEAPLLLADCWQTGQHYVVIGGGQDPNPVRSVSYTLTMQCNPGSIGP